ncbi:hypothetical protein M8J77_015543 [Diaphorina citri]|nr:hypothetical protein M8J77_015543 [Diaphorina citri]
MDRVLWYITPFSASLSLLMVLTSILTGHWLTTTEKMLNGTASGLRQLSYVEKHTVSGLWTLCESDFVRVLSAIPLSYAKMTLYTAFLITQSSIFFTE